MTDFQLHGCYDHTSCVRIHPIQDLYHLCGHVSPIQFQTQWNGDADPSFFSNAFIFPVVYFFFPETRYRSLEEMDGIFKKSSNVFNVVTISLKEPYRYDKQGQLKPEYLEDAIRRNSLKQDEGTEGREKTEANTPDSKSDA